MFKKKAINKKTKNKIYINIVGLFSILIVFYLAFYTFDNLGSFNFQNKQDKTDLNNNESIFDFTSFFLGLKKLSPIKDGNLANNEKEIEDGDNKINILLIGRGGVGHEAPNLTDSIILASINKTYKTISMLSIPRDLYVSYGTTGEGKINEVYAYKRLELSSDEKGIQSLSKVVTNITGEKIDYYISIDFNGFAAFVDAIGGVEITVPKTLIDPEFPDGNWGYRTLVIKEGTWLFDGNTALKYARSRHSTSDFDRSLRQQQIITAIKDKLAQGGFFTKLNKIKNFYEVFKEYVKTDIGITDVINLFNELGDHKDYTILSFNLNDSCFYGDPLCEKGGFLYIPERALFGGASILLPNGAYKGNISNYDEFKNFMNVIFNLPNIYKENIQINIFNSTRIKGIAGDIAMEFKRYGFNIPEKDSIGNVRDKVYTGSLILYNSEVGSSETLLFLKENLNIETQENNSNLPVYADNEDTKIEIILGDDYMSVLESLNDNF